MSGIEVVRFEDKPIHSTVYVVKPARKYNTWSICKVAVLTLCFEFFVLKYSEFWRVLPLL